MFEWGKAPRQNLAFMMYLFPHQQGVLEVSVEEESEMKTVKVVS